MFSSTNLPISASTSKSTGSDFSAAAEDVGAFISFSGTWIWVCLIPNPNNISSGLTTVLGFFFTISCFVAQAGSRHRGSARQSIRGSPAASTFRQSLASQHARLGRRIDAMLPNKQRPMRARMLEDLAQGSERQ